MTVDDWINILDQKQALPYRDKPYSKLSDGQKELWGIFQDWLLDQGENDLALLVELIRHGPNRGGDETDDVFHDPEAGFLRPWYSVRGCAFIRGGWTHEWASRVPAAWGHDLRCTSLAETWKLCFAKAKEHGLCNPPAICEDAGERV